MRIPSTTTALLSALLASVPAIVNAANLTFLIPPHPALLPAGASALPASTHATLHSAGPALSAPLRRDGSFVFVDVAPGSYLLSVHARDHHFEALRVDVEGEVDEETRAEFEEMQKSSPLAKNPATQLQNFDLASFLAGKSNDQPQQQQQVQEKSGGSGAKRRG
ncbi:hypothetical protein MPH_11663 [Macrophomina phaseolina MS6]|uniref:ER membrane protein complex subunit 7 beta-sandwich domain-containing protein n=1 Tax=Macrophomina phaseolina (strain MS6) TaxID=1126212 RepID=K2RE56_MACPH|nr:hypothetical protein MPH_11663 [Macrophomina phaseolina MS6]